MRIKELLTIFTLFLINFYFFRITFLKSTDIFADFYQVIGISHLLTKGYVLYSDYRYNFGPLSPYLNALFLKILGNNFNTFYYISQITILITGISIYIMTRYLTKNIFLCFIICLHFLVIHAYPNTTGYGGHNFVTPYNFASTYTAMFSIPLIYFLIRYLESPKSKFIIVLIFLIICVFLNRFEFGLMFTLLSSIFIFYKYRKIKIVLVINFSVFIFVCAVYSIFLNKISLSDLLFKNILWPPHFQILSNDGAASSLFFGIFDKKNIIKRDFWVSFLFLGPTLIVIFAKNFPGKILNILIYIQCIISILMAFYTKITFLVSFLSFSLCFISVYYIYTKETNIIKLLLLSASILSISRTFLNNTITGSYVFYTGILGFFVIYNFVLIEIPAQFNIQQLKYINAIILLFILTIAGNMTRIVSNMHSYEIKTKKGTIYSFPQKIYSGIQSSIKYLEKNIQKDETVQMLPNTGFFNYIFDKAQPLNYNHYNQVSYQYYGPGKLYKDLKKLKPTYIILHHDLNPHFSAPLFLVNYFNDLEYWLITNNYKMVFCTGDLKSKIYHGGGIAIYKL